MALYQSHIFGKWRCTFPMFIIALEKLLGERVLSGQVLAFIRPNHVVWVALMGILNEIRPHHCNFSLNWQFQINLNMLILPLLLSNFPFVNFRGKLFTEESLQYLFSNYVSLNWISSDMYWILPFGLETLLVVRDKISILYLQLTQSSNR